MDMQEILMQDMVFRYRLLSRMKADCEYYLGYGGRYAGHLWAKNEKDQIACMNALWKSFKEDKKPEWLTFEQILDFEKQMLSDYYLVDCLGCQNSIRLLECGREDHMIECPFCGFLYDIDAENITDKDMLEHFGPDNSSMATSKEATV